MKKKISISMEENTIVLLEEFVKESIFRNKSHFVEHAITKLMKEQENQNIFGSRNAKHFSESKELQ